MIYTYRITASLTNATNVIVLYNSSNSPEDEETLGDHLLSFNDDTEEGLLFLDENTGVITRNLLSVTRTLETQKEEKRQW